MKCFLDHPDVFSHAGLCGLHLIDLLIEILAEIRGLGEGCKGDEPHGRVPGDLQDLCLHLGAQPDSWALWAAPSIHLAWPDAAEPPVHREVTSMLMVAAHLAKCLLDPLDFFSHVELHGLNPSHLLLGLLGERHVVGVSPRQAAPQRIPLLPWGAYGTSWLSRRTPNMGRPKAP